MYAILFGICDLSQITDQLMLFYRYLNFCTGTYGNLLSKYGNKTLVVKIQKLTYRKLLNSFEYFFFLTTYVEIYRVLI